MSDPSYHPHHTAAPDSVLDQLFRDARTHNGWQDEPVSDAQLHALYDLMKMGPTSANCSPARIVFVRSPEAKKKLEPALSEGNRAKTMAAPVVAIIGMDMAFFEQLPKLFPHADARSWFLGNQPMIEDAAFRNSSLQGAYLIMAARSLGIDTGPMSGIDKAKIDAAFFADTAVRTNFICSLGYGDPAKIFVRSPRLTFDEACRVE
ncbi:MAG: malonic semialdehyde reductase [Burkholderiaceae bacterium]